MESKTYWTRVRGDVAKEMCADVKQLAWGVYDVLRSIGLNDSCPFYQAEDNCCLLRSVCDEDRYSRVKGILEWKFPGLCEFGVEVE